MSVPAQGASGPVPAPPAVLTALGLRAATMQDLLVPQTLGQSFQLEVVLGAQRRTLSLSPKNLRSPNFKLLVDDGVAVREVTPPPSNTFAGNVAGVPQSMVRASMVNGQMEAMIDLGGETWWIQPATQAIALLPAQTHVVYRNDNALPLPKCGVPDVHIDGFGSAVAPTGGVLKLAEIGIDCNDDFYVLNGSNVTTATNAATSVMNSVDGIYTRDLQITYAITQIFIRTTNIYTSNTTALLGQFQTYWNQNHASVPRDLAHMFAGRPGGTTGIIGIANLSAVCQKSQAYGVTWFYGGLSGRISIAAHEMGHNWSAQHCDNFNPCYIMCSALNSCSGSALQFEPVSITSITNFKNSRTCLSDPNPPTLTGIAPSAVTSYLPVEVTLTGTALDGVTSLMVGATSVPVFTKVNATTIRFFPPSPFDISTHAVTVTNTAGTSNALNLTVTGNHPSVLTSPPFHPRTFSLDYSVNTDRNWFGALFLSTSQVPSALPGIVSFGIGNGFLELWNLVTLVADNTGFAHIGLVLPATAPTIIIHWQMVTFPFSATFPLETSNVSSTLIF